MISAKTHPVACQHPDVQCVKICILVLITGPDKASNEPHFYEIIHGYLPNAKIIEENSTEASGWNVSKEGPAPVTKEEAEETSGDIPHPPPVELSGRTRRSRRRRGRERRDSSPPQRVLVLDDQVSYSRLGSAPQSSLFRCPSAPRRLEEGRSSLLSVICWLSESSATAWPGE